MLLLLVLLLESVVWQSCLDGIFRQHWKTQTINRWILHHKILCCTLLMATDTLKIYIHKKKLGQTGRMQLIPMNLLVEEIMFLFFIVANGSNGFPTLVQCSLCQYLLEQWSLTGGRQSSLAMSVFLIFRASSTCSTTVGCSVDGQEEGFSLVLIHVYCWRYWTLTDLPFTHSVARELEAIAEPQPNVLNRASMILPFSSTWIWNSADIYQRSTVFVRKCFINRAQCCISARDQVTWSFITSPHAGAPTNPVPTFLSFLSREPTFLGFS